jgi:hypothetical protein
MTDWGIQIGPNPKKVIGRKLPCENLIFGNNSTFPVNDKGDFTIALRSKSIFLNMSLDWNLNSMLQNTEEVIKQQFNNQAMDWSNWGVVGRGGNCFFYMYRR